MAAVWRKLHTIRNWVWSVWINMPCIPCLVCRFPSELLFFLCVYIHNTCIIQFSFKVWIEKLHYIQYHFAYTYIDIQQEKKNCAESFLSVYHYASSFFFICYAMYLVLYLCLCFSFLVVVKKIKNLQYHNRWILVL